MKTFLQTLFFFLMVTQICFGQWYQQNSGTTNSLNSLFFIDSNTGWVVGGDYNYGSIILKTADGGNNWTTQSSGSKYYLRSVYFTDSNKGWAVGGDLQDSVGTILTSTDGGNSWIFQNIQTTRGLYSVYFTDSNTGWVVGKNYDYNGTILKTTDGGNSWTLQYTVIWGFPNNLYSVYFSDSNIGWAVGVLGGMESSYGIILKTTSGGNNWTTSKNFPPIYSVYFTDSNTGWIVGGAYYNGRVYKTTDGGNDWTLQTSGGILPLSSVCFIDSNTGWAVGKSGAVLKTTDGGNSWLWQSSGAISWLSSVYFTDSNKGWAVGEGGTILHTTNGGNPVPVELSSFTTIANGKEVTLSWSTATELNNQGFEVQRKFGSADFVTIGSVKGNGTTTSPNNYTYVDKLTDAGKYFYRLKQIDFGGKYEYSQTVEVNWSPFTSYKLEQNYPNPFNPTTTIGFGIPASLNPSKGGTMVTLKVYDVLGNEISTLVNEEKEAGYHSIDFNGSDLPSGVYFYKLTAGNFINTKKMILLR